MNHCFPRQERRLLPRPQPWFIAAVFSLCVAGWVANTRTFAAAAAASPPLSLEAIRVLKAECWSCHNEEKKKGGLMLTTREAMLKGGTDGSVVELAKPETSRLLQVLQPNADPHMPPKKQLPDAQLDLLRQWLKAGAVWDSSNAAEESEATPAPVVWGKLPDSYHPTLALAFSPDGKRLALGRGADLVVHDLAQTNFPVVAWSRAHRDVIQSLAWTPDGRGLLSGSFRSVIFWDGTNFVRQREFTQGLRGRVQAMQVAPSGEFVALADSRATQDGSIRLVDLADGRIRASWKAHTDTIFDLDFSRDGQQLVTAGGDRLLKIWDIATQKERARLEGHTSQVLGVAFNTNATQVVSGGADKQLKVWDIATREKIISLGQQSASISAVEWPGDGARIVALREAGAVLTYSNLKAHTGEQSSATGDERRLGEAGDTALSLAASADLKILAAGNQAGVVQLWNADGKALGKLEAPFGPAQAEASPDAKEATDPLTKAPSSPRVTLASALAPAPAPPLRTVSRRVSLQPEDLGRVLSLVFEPATVRLSADTPEMEFRVTARMQDEFEVDVTESARFSWTRPAPFVLAGPGRLRGLESGRGALTAHFGGRQVTVPVTLDDNLNAPPAPASPLSFVRDILPVLSRAGCNAGSCHAKPEGQNGFKLSVFSYDPKSDYAEIVNEARGRRIFPSAPEESLLLKKPLSRVPHEGGLRFEPGSETHRLLARWLEQGMVYALTNEPVLERLAVYPKERRYRKGASQRLLVRAFYSDGSVRDVTRLASYAENDKELTKVDENGVVQIGSLTGQGVVVARFQGLVADAQILVPAEHLLPEQRYEAWPRNNFIDDQAAAHFQHLGLFPSDLCTDAEFLRRAKLDAVGLLPTSQEVRDFLADPAPDKRQKMIARIVEDAAYADYWANKWADLLRPNPDRVGVKSVFTLDQWLRDSFRRNQPYDQFVRDILLAEGSNHRDGPAVIYRDRREPAELTTMFSQLFLGTRLECAKCHHHPNERWGQEDFYQFAAFFGPVKQKGAGLSPPISAGMEMFYFTPGGGGVNHPVTGAAMKPRAPDGPALSGPEQNDPRRALVDWLFEPQNPFFAKAAVNRVWAVFFGRGLVEPVDDFRVSNPCVNPPLLDALARSFQETGYDMKKLLRTIMESRLYQLSATPNTSNLGDTRNFSRAYRRRLPAEVLADAVADATGVPDKFTAMPLRARATQTWSYKIQSHFLDAFGRPNSSSDCPCERDTHMSVVQSLHLMNAQGLQAKLSDTSGRARLLADSSRSTAEVIAEIYLATLSRLPSAEETETAAAAFSAKDATRRTATEDVFWALLNSPEFVFNH
jgi:WD40 repeat protein